MIMMAMIEVMIMIGNDAFYYVHESMLTAPLSLFCNCIKFVRPAGIGSYAFSHICR